ncbi:MAG: hypothetical protein V3T83_22435 [Acidobacteriota bacterium]
MNHLRIFNHLTHTFLAQPLLALLLIAPIAGAAPPQAQPAQHRPAGLWEGAVNLPTTSLQFSLKLWQTGQGWGGAISIPAQNLSDFPLQSVQVTEQSLTFAMKGMPGDPVFKGEFSADGSTIQGELSQSGMTVPFQLEWKGDAVPVEKPESADAESAQPFLGSWQGELETPGQRILIRFHIKEGPKGSVVATMDSPDQGQSGLPVSRIEVDERTLRLHLSYLKASFQGSLSEDGEQIVGTWKQGGVQLPLTMKAYSQ